MQSKLYKKQQLHSPKRKKKSPPHSPKSAFSKWLSRQSHSCIQKITSIKDKAQDLVNKTLPMTKKHILTKRGIKPLGSLISYLTDLPSPDAWEDTETLITHLNDVVNGQTTEQQLLEHTVSDQTHIINRITKEIKNILKVEYRIKEEILNDHAYYLNNHERIEFICSQATLLANAMLEDALIIEDIRKCSRSNKPSEHLFPLNDIYKKTKHLSIKENSPIFSEPHELENIYDMNNCFTTFENNYIYSVISLPLVDYTYQYNFINHPILKTHDQIILDQVQKKIIKSLDLILCLKANHNLIIMSSSDLRKCTKTPNNKIYICSGRQIRHTVQKTDCSELPLSIVLELSPNLLPIRIRQESTIKIDCRNDNISKKVTLKTTFTFLKLKAGCSIVANDFWVSTHHKNITDHLLSEPFTVIKVDLGPDNEKLQEHYMNHSFKISNLTDKLNKDQQAADYADKINTAKLFSLKNKLTLHSSIGFGLSSIIGALLLGLLIRILLKHRKCYKINNKQNTQKEKSIETIATEPNPKKYLTSPIEIQ